MKVHRKKTLLLFLLFGVGFTMACKKDKQTSKTTLIVVPPVIEVPQKNYIPTQLGSGKSKMTLTYTSNHSILKIEYADGSSAVLSYTPYGKPLEFSRYNGKTLVFSSLYELDKNGVVISADQYTVTNGNFNWTGYYTLTYNTSQQLTVINYYNTNDKLLLEEHKTYASSGNLINDKSNPEELTLDYLYDSNNGLFKNAKYAWLLSTEKENRLFLSVLNNIQQCNYPLMPDSNLIFSYTYNTNKYPETISSTAKGTTLPITVTYVEATE